MVLKDNLEKAHEVFKDNKSKLIFAALFTLIIKFSLSLTPEYDYLEMSDNLSSSSVQDLRKTELSKAMDSIDNITSSL